VALAPRLEKWWAGRSDAVSIPPRFVSDGDDDPRAERDPRLAIIRAYACFERALAGARAPRLPCQTPREFMRTTLARLPLPVSPVARLTTLFEAARFSERRVDVESRDTACDCLDQITAALDTEDAGERRAPPLDTAHCCSLWGARGCRPGLSRSPLRPLPSP